MYKKLPYLVKNDEDIVEFENHPNFQEVEKDSNPVQNPTSSGNDGPKIYTKQELEAMKNSELLAILTNLGAERMPRILQNKIKLILELQESKGVSMAEETETTETSEENDEESSDESDKEE